MGSVKSRSCDCGCSDDQGNEGPWDCSPSCLHLATIEKLAQTEEKGNLNSGEKTKEGFKNILAKLHKVVFEL